MKLISIKNCSISHPGKNPSSLRFREERERERASLRDTIVCRRRWNDIPESARQSFYTVERGGDLV